MSLVLVKRIIKTTELLTKTGLTDQVSAETLKELRSIAENDFYFFAKGILGFDWLVPHVHKNLCELLEDFTQNTRIKLTLPRGWLKTTLCSIAYPSWRAVKNPNVRIMLVQNTFTNACAKLRSIRAIFERNELFRALWPEVLPGPMSVWKNDSLCVSRSGTFPESTFEAAGTNTQVTSRHYDVIIEDDTVAPERSDLGEENLAPSKEDVVQAIGYHRLVVPLLTNPKTAQNIVVGTRWFDKDLLSWIDENEKEVFRSYSRACREDENGRPDPTGKLTYPERFGDDVLEQLSRALGPYMFSCLYMNQPVRSADMLFLLDWISYYDAPQRDLAVYTTIDLADDPESTRTLPDRNVVLTAGKDLVRGNVYVLDYFAERCNPGKVIDKLFEHVEKYNPLSVRIETVAYQGSMLYWVKEQMRKREKFFLVEGLKHGKKSKQARIQGLQPLVQSGTLKFRRWMTELVGELLAFPLGATDDIADALAMQLELWRNVRTKAGQQLDQSEEDFTLEGALRAIDARRRKKKETIKPPFDVLERNTSCLQAL